MRGWLTASRRKRKHSRWSCPGLDEEQKHTLGALLFDGSRSDKKADRAPQDFRGLSSARALPAVISTPASCREPGAGVPRAEVLRELRSDDLEPELLRDRDCGVRVVSLHGWLGRLAHRHSSHLEHPLKARGRDDYQRPRAVGLHFEGVWHPAWPPHPGTGAGEEFLRSLAEADLAIEHVEALVLAAVYMQRRPEAPVEARLDQAERTPGVLGPRLDLIQAALPPEGVLLDVRRGGDVAHGICSLPALELGGVWSVGSSVVAAPRPLSGIGLGRDRPPLEATRQSHVGGNFGLPQVDWRRRGASRIVDWWPPTVPAGVAVSGFGCSAPPG